jgi:hypothetical protein
MYIAELQHELLEAWGIAVSKTTIRRTLCRRGYSRKKVCSNIVEAHKYHCSSTHRSHALHWNETKIDEQNTK